MKSIHWTFYIVVCAVVAAVSYLLLREQTAESPGVTPQGDERLIEAPVEPDCGIVLASPGSHRNLALAERQLHIGDYFRSLADAGRSRLEQAAVAELAGLGHAAARPRYAPLADGGVLASPVEVSYQHPRTERRRLTLQERNHVAEVADGGDMATFLERTVADSSQVLKANVADRRLVGDRGPTSVLGLLIRRRGADLLNLLTHAPAAPVGLHELAVAIEENVQHDAFLALLEMSDPDPRSAWQDRDPFLAVTLAWVAAVNARPEALRTLLARGVDPTAGGRPVMDEAVLSAPVSDSAAFADVAEQLLASGVVPNFPSTVSALRRYGVRDVGIHPDAAAALADTELQAAAAELKALVASRDVDIARAEEAERRCGTALAEADGQRGAATLEAKLRHEEALRRRADWIIEQGRRMQETLDEQLDDEPLGEEFDRLFDLALNLAVVEGRWEAAIAVVEGHAHMSPYHYRILLSLSLMRGAEFDVIARLADRSDGVLPDDAILHLASRTWLGSAAAAEKLERLYGLDVHYMDDDGRNAISKLIGRVYDTGGGFSPQTMQMADFLASRSVTPKPSSAGLDPLDSVLLALLENRRAKQVGIHYARWLVDLGAPIEASHLQLVEKLRLRDTDSHRRLIEAVPALGT